ncbi:low molecular weight protein-tyrosine-phosphatase [Acinetobacter sp. ANC 3791]|uniref:low molecular weight protein-tyrosine-phosphatase n=1 Tax=Acinetobacter sp. ANC 3791 TaxID=2529836 RepID=UPI0010389EEA|nr:low molecular weight protein-tyrosine-phosphatase [Acinetobacter sp. ANC 3791]TCB85177.1 low molecular weight phosphotyrosine protein phosphatase [Acinetobacter sp. ANC 3791]
MKFQKLLVVCIGNICRSPMVEYLLKQEFPTLEVSSAGIHAMVGHPADEKTIHAMQHLQTNISSHVARQLDSTMLKQADLVLVMTMSQQQHIEKTWTFSKGKVFRLGHWQNKDILDPYQQDQAFFDQTCSSVQHCLADWHKYL